MPDVNEWLMIRKLDAAFFKWFPGHRRDVHHNLAGSQSGPAVVRRTSGNIGAIALFDADAVVSSQASA
jgi:hypothetical protein